MTTTNTTEIQAWRDTFEAVAPDSPTAAMLRGCAAVDDPDLNALAIAKAKRTADASTLALVHRALVAAATKHTPRLVYKATAIREGERWAVKREICFALAPAGEVSVIVPAANRLDAEGARVAAAGLLEETWHRMNRPDAAMAALALQVKP